jgi:hypothetical protein
MNSTFPPPHEQLPNDGENPDAWWPPKRWGVTQRLIAILSVVLLIAVVVGSLTNEGSQRSPRKTKGQELCQLLRDPANRQLTRGDVERLTDMTDYELQRYVAGRCPEQSDRVD